MAADPGSKNGSFVNGKRLQGTVVLEEGDVIDMGKSRLVFTSKPVDGEGAARKTESLLDSAEEKKGEGEKKVPHLFFADPNGDHKLALPGDQSQSDLWKVMFKYLDRCYDENAKKAIKQLRKLLGQYDKLDAQEDLVRGRIDKEIEKNGPKSRKLKKFNKDLDKLAKEREELRAREQELRDLALKSSEELVGDAR